MPSAAEMSDSSQSSQSESEADALEYTPVHAAASGYKQGPAELTYKGKRYIRNQREGNQRAFSKSSVIGSSGMSMKY